MFSSSKSEYENNIITEATKLGGIRLKQTDLVLKELQTAAESLQEQLIGSILINRLTYEDNNKI
jgi:hypothetical protein